MVVVVVVVVVEIIIRTLCQPTSVSFGIAVLLFSAVVAVLVVTGPNTSSHN